MCRSRGAALVMGLVALSCAAFERQSGAKSELALGRMDGGGRVTVHVDPRVPAVVLDGEPQTLPLVDAVLAYGEDEPVFTAEQDLVIAGAAELVWHVQAPSEVSWTRWELSIFDEAGAEVWRVQGLGEPPPQIPWQLGRGGAPLKPPGVYRYRIAASTAAGNLGEGRWRRVRSVPRRRTRLPVQLRSDEGRHDPEDQTGSAAAEGKTFTYPGFVTVDGAPAPADAPSETTVAVRPGASVVVDLRERAGRRVRLVRSYPLAPEPSEAVLEAAGSIADGVLRLGSEVVSLPLVAADCTIGGSAVVTAEKGGLAGVHFALEAPGPIASWLVRVVDGGGHKVAELDGLGPPPVLVPWSATNAEGSPVPAGVYRYRCLFLDDRGNRTMTAPQSFVLEPTASGVDLTTGSVPSTPRWWGDTGLRVRLADHLLPLAPDGTFAGSVAVAPDGSIDLELSSTGGRTTVYRIPLASGKLARSTRIGIPQAGAPPASPYVGSGPAIASATAPEQEAAPALLEQVHRQRWLIRAALFAAADQPSFGDSLTVSDGVDAISGYAAQMPDKRLDASGRPPLGDPSGPSPMALPSGPAPILPPSGPRPRHFPPSGPPLGVEIMGEQSLVPQA